MGSMTATTTQRAKKFHRCSWCWEEIQIGETYARYRYFDYGEAGTCKMHPECLSAMEDAAREEGGWIEWTPGQDRPIASEAKMSTDL